VETQISRKQILDTLLVSYRALPAVQPETVFQDLLLLTGIEDKDFYALEETAVIAEALMARAVKEGQGALDVLAADLQASS
jgi:hypothetical protein